MILLCYRMPPKIIADAFPHLFLFHFDSLTRVIYEYMRSSRKNDTETSIVSKIQVQLGANLIQYEHIYIVNFIMVG